MSIAHAVAHGAFGRTCLFGLDRQMVPHAHREGHLIFHVSGPPAQVVVDGQPLPLSPTMATAISPWQPHYFKPIDLRQPTLTLVLYIRPGWFVEASRQASGILRFGRSTVEMSTHLSRLVTETARVLAQHRDGDGGLEDRLGALTQAAFDLTWQWTSPADVGAAEPGRSCDFRLRRAITLLSEKLGEPIDLAAVSRAAGLSRPHFFKLFREQMGLPPTLFLNALRMERAIDRLARGEETVSEIGFDLGFATPASFSRFFIANGVVPPSAYRRNVVGLAH
ncbi:AraC family transcriptional regulator [Prosthecodimorpha staleyi]|uniref:AraC family transcriptional regulator n=1 Tax=Prosthecodimorpha staleyi TaxID=2840188 RepID=A0A947DBI1_9HYPH|nr:AraC family transcriptional regulator [Prosthecodimorpha staleyi]MBT9292677.1 AraC family transcriptional regulator [Prosthecodimorpha staleyi]